MRGQRALDPTPSRQSLLHESRILIEFGGRQLLVTTDNPAVGRQIADTFAHMLTDTPAGAIDELRIVERNGGFEFPAIDQSGPVWGDDHSVTELLKQEVLYRFMRLRDDLLWLHAAAVGRARKCVLLPGGPGSGKSTMASALLDGGWTFLSDDVAPLTMEGDRVLPYPQAGRRRVDEGRTLPEEEVWRLTRTPLSPSPQTIQREPIPVAAIVFPSYSANGDWDMTRLSAGEVAIEILRHVMNFGCHRHAAVRKAAHLATSIPAYRLTYSSPVERTRIASLVESGVA